MAKASYASLVPQVKVFVALIAGVWLADYSHLDFWLEQQFFNHQAQVFTWRHHWLLDTLLHHGLKNLMYIRFSLHTVSHLCCQKKMDQPPSGYLGSWRNSSFTSANHWIEAHHCKTMSLEY